MVDNQLRYGYTTANIGITLSFVICATIAVVFRSQARRISGAYYSWDDYTIVVALILCLGLCVVVAWAAVNGGLGVLKNALDEATATVYLKQKWVQKLLFALAIGVVKMLVCLFYRCVLYIDETFRICTHVMIVVSVCWAIAFFLTSLLSYLPISLQWSLSSHIHRTLIFARMIIALAATDIFLDVAILSMPIPMIRRLKLLTKKKWMLGGMFGLGAFRVFASTIQLIFTVLLLSEFVRDTHNRFNRGENQIAIWSNIGPCASVVCACLSIYGLHLSRSGVAQSDSILNRLRTFTSHLSARSLLRPKNVESTSSGRTTDSDRKTSDNTDVTEMAMNTTAPTHSVQLGERPGGPKERGGSICIGVFEGFDRFGPTGK